MASRELEFLNGFPRGIYNCSILWPYSGGELDPMRAELCRRELSSAKFIQGTDEFFEQWLNEHRNEKSSLLGSREFELKVPEVRSQEFEGGLTRGVITGFAVASDLGWHFADELVFVVNDTSSKRVLVYRDGQREKMRANPLGKKELTPQSLPELRKYPYRSLNTLKSDYCTWTALQIKPEEIYASLRKIGFYW